PVPGSRYAADGRASRREGPGAVPLPPGWADELAGTRTSVLLSPPSAGPAGPARGNGATGNGPPGDSTLPFPSPFLRPGQRAALLVGRAGLPDAAVVRRPLPRRPRVLKRWTSPAE